MSVLHTYVLRLVVLSPKSPYFKPHRPFLIAYTTLFLLIVHCASSADEETRLKLLNFAQQMQYRLERPADMVQRVAMAVRGQQNVLRW